MDYQGRIIRPPSEADSILLQVTTGCSHNKCTFCGAYKDKRFSIKPGTQIAEDLTFARHHCRNQRRLFLCDGDSLVIPQKRLLSILKEIRAALPWVTRIGTYANARAIHMKSVNELQELRENGLGMIYMGLESGDDQTLRSVHKWGDSERMIQEAAKVKQAGIKLNVTVLLGLAGTERSFVHGQETGRVLSSMDPEQVAALTLMLIPGTPLHEDSKKGRFKLPDARSMLMELRTILKHTHLTRGLFLANHASNYLPLKIRLPRDRESTLALIDQAVEGTVPLTPERFRRL